MKYSPIHRLMRFNRDYQSPPWSKKVIHTVGQKRTFNLITLVENMPDYRASWQRTERLLITAKTLFLPEVAETNKTGLQQFDEFLDANELGLAFELLESITYEDQPTCLPLLHLLRSAAEEMDMHESMAELDNRMSGLETSRA